MFHLRFSYFVKISLNLAATPCKYHYTLTFIQLQIIYLNRYWIVFPRPALEQGRKPAIREPNMACKIFQNFKVSDNLFK